MNKKLFELLRLICDGRCYSGEVLGRDLGVSRTAVWKYLGQLKQYGLEFESQAGAGYRLKQAVILLNEARIKNALNVQAEIAISLVSSVPSTNQFFLDAFTRAEQIHGKVLIAEHQSQGRGRRGRTWQSPLASNLYFSIAWAYSQGIGVVEGLSLAVGVAICRALSASGIDGASLKWPNDVLWRGKKLAGILIEICGDASGEFYIVVGVGLNVNMFSNEEIDQPWVSLSGITGRPWDRNLLVCAILNELVPVLSTFPEKTFSSYQNEWEALDALRGESVVVSSGKQSVSGLSQGVSETGSLQLSVDGELREFSGGELSLRGC